jgi:hypothetical protein
MAGETGKAVEALSADPAHRRRFDAFVSAMVYGEGEKYATALATAMTLAETMMR